MNTPTHNNSNDRPRDEPEGDDQLGQLLRIVGPRKRVPAPRQERVRRAVRDAWLEEVGQHKNRRTRVWAKRGLTFGGLALAALLLLTVGLRFWNAKAVDPSGRQMQVATVDWAPGRTAAEAEAPIFTVGQAFYSGDEITTDAHRLALRLASGPALRLDVGTRLRLDTASSLTLETGTIYIDSEGAPNGLGSSSTALEVHTIFGIARDIGTQFEVRVTRSDLRLRVREGKVLLKGETSHQAEPGDELTVDADGVSRSQVTPHDESWVWIHDAAPRWDPEGRTLEEILQWISRETGLAVRYQDPTVVEAKLPSRFHGSMPTLRPDQAAEILLPTFGLIARQEGGTLTIESY